MARKPKIFTNSVDEGLVRMLQTMSNDPVLSIGEEAVEKIEDHNVFVVDYSSLPEIIRINQHLFLRFLKGVNKQTNNQVKALIVGYDGYKHREDLRRFHQAGMVVDWVPKEHSKVPEILELRVINTYHAFQKDNDELTMLHNRRYLMEALDKAIERTKESALSGSLSAVIYDLDHFKNINDHFGHNIGDEVLKKFSRVLKSTYLRPERDALGRYGGEEFLVISERTDFEDAYELAKKVLKRTSEIDLKAININSLLEEKFQVTTSCGIGSFDGYNQEQTASQLIKLIDDRLYVAKNSGRNRISGPESYIDPDSEHIYESGPARDSEPPKEGYGN